MKRIFREYKTWALITGAASGMGRVYARRLAEMGYNLVLVDRNGKGLEETAREMRYAFLREAAEKAGADVIATAHNLNDQAETLLLHLCGGAACGDLAEWSRCMEM